jgi:Flp pilus assembly protein TadG
MTMRFKRSISPAGGVVRCVSRFGRREDGSAIVFTLFMISVLLLVTGYAIDAARFESTRARLQGTLDRAVLAAASLKQSLPCEDVVEDYFAKADMADKIDEIKCDVSKTGRTANASASFEMNTMFMEGVDTLVAPAAGSATESVSDIEIVLALDVTGSMAGQKIADLRLAAQAFTDKVLGADKDNRVSIAVVPYHEQVFLDSWLLDALPGVVGRLGGSDVGCIDLPPSVWSSAAIDPSTTMPQQPFVQSVAGGTTSYIVPPVLKGSPINLNCRLRDAYMAVKLPSQDITGIKAGLGALQTNGNTSIFTGMKWALTMIDPLMRPIYDEAIKDKLMPATLSGRPYDYDRGDTMKVIVLMTDGDHVASNYVNQPYHSGPSGIYRGEDGNYAIHHPTRAGVNKFFVPHLGPGQKPRDTDPGWQAAPLWPGSGIVTQLDWVDVWKNLGSEWVIQLYARPLSDNIDALRMTIRTAQNAAMYVRTDVATMDSQLLATCTQAKDLGVLVFTIAFMAPAKAETLLRDCASGAPYYYEPTGGDIKNAFDSIANTINVLRLTQ